MGKKLTDFDDFDDDVVIDKKLKRKYLKGAFSVVEDYEAPIALANEIEAENELEEA